jgi:hypothetical protein
VHDLPQQPKVWADPLAEGRELSKKAQVHAVCRIQPEPIDRKVADPRLHCLKEMISDLQITQGQLDQVIVAVPPFVGKGIVIGTVAGKVESPEPVTVGRVLAAFQDVAEGPEITPYVVECVFR